MVEVGEAPRGRASRAGWVIGIGIAGLHAGPRCCRALALAAAVLVFAGPARAQIGSERYSSMVMQAGGGEVVSTINPDEPRYPASLTKMMTLYMAFEALRDRRITLGERVPVTEHAASMMPSKLGLVPGSQITVEQAIMALVTKSANDAASALGELMAGDEERFGQMMTLRARALGMSRTVFRNASGLPDPQQVTTARDLALLARHLVQDFPADYHYFSIPSFVFRGRIIPNHDHMLQSYPGADGIKTGYTEASGFNLVTSATRGEVRLIGVVLGAARPGERDQHMAALLDAAFQQMGVPVEPRQPTATRLGLLASAQAASVPSLMSSAIGPPRALVTRVSTRRGTAASGHAAHSPVSRGRALPDSTKPLPLPPAAHAAPRALSHRATRDGSG